MREWLSLMLSEAPGEPSVRRVVFFVVFVSAILLWVLGIFVTVPPDVWDVVKTTILAASSVMGVGRVAEIFERRGV